MIVWLPPPRLRLPLQTSLAFCSALTRRVFILTLRLLAPLSSPRDTSPRYPHPLDTSRPYSPDVLSRALVCAAACRIAQGVCISSAHGRCCAARKFLTPSATVRRRAGRERSRSSRPQRTIGGCLQAQACCRRAGVRPASNHNRIRTDGAYHAPLIACP
jgi:hypothetical protein